MKIFVQNNNVHDYKVDYTFTSGIVLTGAEVKSIRAGKSSLTGGSITPTQKGIILFDFSVQPYSHDKAEGHNINRQKLIYVTKEEVRKLTDFIVRGYSLIPICVFEEKGFLKLRFGIAKVIKKADKRQKELEKEHRKEMDA